MPMHTSSYNDEDGRQLVKKHLEEQGYLVYDPDYNTGKVGDLFVVDPETKKWHIVEVEQMGSSPKTKEYAKTMKRFTTGKQTPRGNWKPGLSIPPRKFGYTPADHEVSDRLKKEMDVEDHDEPLKWSKYYRIMPKQDGMFVADRGDISGSVKGVVETENAEFYEERPTVPWDKVKYIDLT